MPRNDYVTASARHPSAASPQVLTYLSVEPADNGFTVSSSFRTKGPLRINSIDMPEPKRMLFKTPEEVGAYVTTCLKGKSGEGKAHEAAETSAYEKAEREAGEDDEVG